MKVLFLSRYLNFCPNFFGDLGKRLDKKVKINFKTYDVTDLKQISTIHILPNILRRKGNCTMKFAQLIEYNMRHIFLEKLCTEYDAEASLRPLYEISKLLKKLV